jgi:hypothetical protein
MQTTATLKIQWALEDAGRLLLQKTVQSIKLGLTLLMVYSLAPPLWDAIFAPTMAAAYELPYTAAKRVDRALSVAQALGVKLPVVGSGSNCSVASQWMRQAMPAIAGKSEVQLLAPPLVKASKGRRHV